MTLSGRNPDSIAFPKVPPEVGLLSHVAAARQLGEPLTLESVNK